MMAVGASSLLGWSWGGGLFVTGVWEAQPVASSYSLPKFSLFVRFPPPRPQTAELRPPQRLEYLFLMKLVNR